MTNAILSVEDVVVYESDVGTLEPGQWLNDTILEFYFQVLDDGQSNLCFLSPSMAFLMLHSPDPLGLFADGVLPTKRLQSANVILLPINDNEDVNAAGGSHWSLLVHDKDSRRSFCYDSMNSDRNTRIATRAHLLLSSFFPHPNEHTPLVMIDTPHQINGYDCGVYVLAMAEILTKRLWTRCGVSEKPGDLASWKMGSFLTPERITQKRIEIKTLIYYLAEKSKY